MRNETMDVQQPTTNEAFAKRMDRRLASYVWGVILLGVAVTGFASWDQLSRPFELEWLVLLLLTLASGLATLRIPGILSSFSIGDIFSIVAALLVGPAAGALTAALDGLVLSYRMSSSQRSAHRVLFNMATLAVATWVAATVFFALAGSNPLFDGPLGALRLLALLVVFGALDFSLSTGMVAVAISFERHEPFLSIWRQHFIGLWITYLGGVFAAMLMMVLSRTSAIEALILIIPIPVLLYVTFRHALGRSEDQITHLAKMNKVYLAAIEALAQAIDAKDQVTHDHIRRVQEDSLRVARALAVDDERELQAIKAASLLHDVGKIAVPEHILNKPGRLSPSEFQIMKKHAPVGADILSVIGFPYPVAPIVRHHHECWDGSGYPDGLAGEAIPLGARILAVVDCFDALTSDRPYRPRLEDREALKILADRRGSMYDPRVVDIFFELHAAKAPSAEQPVAATRPPTADPHRPLPSLASEHARSQFDLHAFYDLGRALDAPVSDSQIGATLWAHIEAHVPASAFVLFSYQETTDSLAPRYQAGERTLSPDSRLPLGERLSGWVAAARQPIINSDARLDLDEDVREESLLRSALSVPVTRGGRIVGVLAFYSRDLDAFTDSHRRIAEAASYVVAESVGRLAREPVNQPVTLSRHRTILSRS
jgi:putative nucleotidyltransferase with HDIG domain